MSDWRSLLSLWNHLREAGEHALLFSIVDIQGSSYRRLGAHMLVSKTGQQAGTISAGCLESDLLTQVDEFFKGQLPRIVSYDNRGDDIFALNAGCAGAICILIEDAFADERNPLYIFADVNVTRNTGTLATIIDGPPALVGTRLGAAETAQIIEYYEITESGVVESDIIVGEDTAAATRISIEVIYPPLRLIIFGAQQDGHLLAELAARTGMSVIMADWRQRLLEPKNIQQHAVEIVRARGNELAIVSSDSRTAVVVMSHNFQQDKAALASMLDRQLPYLGIMGPCQRTMQMLTDLKRVGESTRLRFPVGLDIGADGPEEIAVSIMAEIVSVFSRTGSKALSTKDAPIHASVSSGSAPT
jgi:xanthine/CO dehydrogenase XdhC/CoxF family maturation factor